MPCETGSRVKHPQELEGNGERGQLYPVSDRAVSIYPLEAVMFGTWKGSAVGGVGDVTPA